MSIYVAKAINYEHQPVSGVYDELVKGKARFGWSWKDNQDLRVIKHALERYESLDEAQQEAKKCMGFLRRLQIGDYLLYPHQPQRNKFTVVKIKGEYDYDDVEGGIGGDFRSFRPCETIAQAVDNYDQRVPSQLRYRLGMPGRFSRVYDTGPFDSFKKDYDPGEPEQLQDETNTIRIRRIHNRLREGLPAALRREFTQADLSRRFCPELFERMGYTCEVQEGPNEAGSDLVVTVGNPLIDSEKRIGVQVFAYEGSVGEANFREKLGQLVRGWDFNKLDFGVLLTTASCGEENQNMLENHNRENSELQIKLIDGDELADLFLRYFTPGTE